jgi:hypothetical protein
MKLQVCLEQKEVALACAEYLARRRPEFSGEVVDSRLNVNGTESFNIVLTVENPMREEP